MVALVQTIVMILELYKWVIFVAVAISLLINFNVINAYSPAVRAIWQATTVMTEPVFRPIRRILPATGSIDFSPLVVLIIIFFLQRFIPEILLSP